MQKTWWKFALSTPLSFALAGLGMVALSRTLGIATYSEFISHLIDEYHSLWNPMFDWIEGLRFLDRLHFSEAERGMFGVIALLIAPAYTLFVRVFLRTLLKATQTPLDRALLGVIPMQLAIWGALFLIAGLLHTRTNAWVVVCYMSSGALFYAFLDEPLKRATDEEVEQMESAPDKWYERGVFGVALISVGIPLYVLWRSRRYFVNLAAGVFIVLGLILAGLGTFVR